MSGCVKLDIPALMTNLATDRVLLRPFTFSDIDDVYLSWLRDPEVVQFSSQRFYLHTIKSCRVYFDSFSDSTNYFLAICNPGSRKMLGTLTVYRSLPHHTADIGIMIGDRKVWGQGIGAEAFCLVLSTLKASGVIRKVTAGALSANSRMIRIMEKAGMQHEATRHAQELLNGVPVDVVYYATFCHE